jgi:hypothetical protein
MCWVSIPNDFGVVGTAASRGGYGRNQRRAISVRGTSFYSLIDVTSITGGVCETVWPGNYAQLRAFRQTESPSTMELHRQWSPKDMSDAFALCPRNRDKSVTAIGQRPKLAVLLDLFLLISTVHLTSWSAGGVLRASVARRIS